MSMRQASLLKFFDGWLGRVLATLLPKPPVPVRIDPPQAVLVIRPGGIGDAVLLLPALVALCRTFPQCAVDVLAERRNAGVFALAPTVRRAYVYDRPGQLVSVLANRYDVVIDTEQWHRMSAVTSRLVRAPIKIGFATNERLRMFTHIVEYHQNDYEVHSFLRLLEPLTIRENALPKGSWLRVPKTAQKVAASFLGEISHRPFVVIFPGASIPEKHWAIERFYTVANWCLAQGLQVVIVGGKEDCSAGIQVSAKAMGAVNLAGKTSLAETAAILNASSVVISGDSGILHVAAGLNRPTVALFGPSSVEKWAPRGDRHIVLRKADCPSCAQFGYTPPCLYGCRCMDDIAVVDVTDAISQLLNFQKSTNMP